MRTPSTFAPSVRTRGTGWGGEPVPICMADLMHAQARAQPFYWSQSCRPFYPRRPCLDKIGAQGPDEAMWLRRCESRSYYVEASVSFAAATAITRIGLGSGAKPSCAWGGSCRYAPSRVGLASPIQDALGSHAAVTQDRRALEAVPPAGAAKYDLCPWWALANSGVPYPWGRARHGFRNRIAR